ncbi:MAG TPA: acyltransferase [Puia sp.]|nr:acyltransferase [Puia sp.]
MKSNGGVGRKEKPHVYFKNLDGIRFIAATMVVLQHCFSFKYFYFQDRAAHSFLDDWFSSTGRLGVNLFFVLSGFLISYLLLTEKDTTGTISYRNFYIRRILRIWPLYIGYGLFLTFFSPYVASVLGMNGTVTAGEVLVDLAFLFLFSVNYQLAFMPYNRDIFEVSWSVCMEEQFYLLWPLLMNKCRKYLKTLVAVMFGISITVRIVVTVVLPHFIPLTPKRAYDINFLMLFDKLDLFTGGLIIALFYYHRDKYQGLIRKLFHPAVQVVMIALAACYVLSVFRLKNMGEIFFDHYVCDILFGYLLLAAVLGNFIFNFEGRLIRTLGRVSYGIYIYHIAVCQVIMFLFRKYVLHPESHLIYDLIYPLICLTLTCVVAWLSYTYYESWFLRKKKKFEAVVSAEPPGADPVPAVVAVEK